MVEARRTDNCAFCRIAAGDSPGDVVFEDERSVAFLDQRPLFPGHCLLIPKIHYETLSDLPADLIEPLFSSAQIIARAMETELAAEGSFVAINNRVSQSVPHLHIHIVPRRRKDGLRGFFWPRQTYKDSTAMIEVRDRLRAAIAQMRRERA